MGCDGIWEVKTNRDICIMIKNKLKNNMELKTIACNILDDLLAPNTSNQTGLDNMTLLIIKKLK